MQLKRATRQADHRNLPAGPEFHNYHTPSQMRSEEFRAMGTTVSLLFLEQQAEKGSQIVRTLFSKWEQTLSRFLPESELSRLNRHTGTFVAVSNLLYTVLATALRAARATEGVYDPALLDQLVQAGYDRNFDDLPAGFSDSLFSPLPGGRWQEIQIDPLYHRVMLPIGLRLDFGGIAKGMAVDAALERLKQNGIATALINAGGDLAIAGLPPEQEQWLISVPGQEQLWSLPICAGAVATSGIARRHWWKAGTLQHHLLDPCTGQSAQSDLWSVTVVADHCAQAEVAAKVAFILGAARGSDFLRKHHMAGLLIHADGSWETVEPWPQQLMKEMDL